MYVQMICITLVFQYKKIGGDHSTKCGILKNNNDNVTDRREIKND